MTRRSAVLVAATKSRCARSGLPEIQLSKSTEQLSLAEVLRPLLDRWWDNGLCEIVGAGLKAFARPARPLGN